MERGRLERLDELGIPVHSRGGREPRGRLGDGNRHVHGGNSIKIGEGIGGEKRKRNGGEARGRRQLGMDNGRRGPAKSLKRLSEQPLQPYGVSVLL